MKKKHITPNYLGWVYFFCGIIIIGAGVLRVLNFFSNPILREETKSNEMKTIPQDVVDLQQNSKPKKTFRVPIIIYHYVEYVQDAKDTIRKSLDITPDVFENQVKTLKDAGYTFITMRELSDVIDGKIHLPQKPVIMTFDDGYRDFYTDAFPIIKKYGVKVVAYIIPGFNNKPNYMYTSQIQEIARSGLVEVGAHTVNHVYLKGDRADRVKHEITESKKMLEQELGIPVGAFAYPYGAFDKQAISLVQSAGYTSAVSTLLGVQANVIDRYYLPRLRIGILIGEALLRYIESYPENKQLSQTDNGEM